MTAVKIIQCQHSPRSASGTRPSRLLIPLALFARHLVHALWNCLRGAHVQPVGPGLLAFSCTLAMSARHLVHALGTVHEAPTLSQWVPAFSLPRALWHCLRAIPYMPLALSTRSHVKSSPFDVKAVKTISVQESFLRCGKQPSRTTNRISVCSVKKARLPVAGVHI